MSEEKHLDLGRIDQLKNKLSENIQGLYFPSETDAPIEVIEIDDAGNIQSKLSAEVGGSETEITEVKLSDFLDMYGTEKDWQNPIQKAFARKFGDAVRQLQEQVLNVKVFRVGGIRATLYIIGQSSDSDWIGLKTSIVET